MKTILSLFISSLMLFTHSISFGQKQTYDVISFSKPKNWQEQQKEGGLQLLISDQKTGNYALAIITKPIATSNNAATNFQTEWNRIVKGTVQINNEPEMQPPSEDKGWTIISGNASYTDGNQKGVATLLTATTGNKMVSVILMTNSSVYENDLLNFLGSLDIAAAENASTIDVAHSNKGNSLIGLWVNYSTETAGTINGMPQLTAGYFRSEYSFYEDGTYLFRIKNWSVLAKEIQFVYESGRWKQNGNKLTITPQQGKGGWWNKAADGTTKGWGKLTKSGTWKLEPITYTIEMEYMSNINKTKLSLQSSSPTERESKNTNNVKIYSSHSPEETMIDNPPGIKTGFENKAFITKAGETSSTTNATTINKDLLGSWRYASSEKYFGDNSPGYSTRQYSFFDDGTYTFQHKFFSSFMTVLLFQYEYGKYSINGNQITITPTSGANEEWSKQKEHPDRWGTKQKTNKRKLEKTTYQFTLHYYSGLQETNLILQTTSPTEREGSFGLLADFPKGWAFKPCNNSNTPEIVPPPGFKKR